jgi:hypothetical protein
MEVLKAGGRFHGKDDGGDVNGGEAWFTKVDAILNDIRTYKTGGVLSDGRTAAADTPVDMLLVGDDVFDRFDDPAENTYDNGSGPVNQYENLLSVSGIPNTVNASIEGNTVGDARYIVEQIIALGDGRPAITRIIFNLSANDLYLAGSTQSIQLGSSGYGPNCTRISGLR